MPDHAEQRMIGQRDIGEPGTRPRWAAEAACCDREARLRGLGLPDLMLNLHTPLAIFAKPAYAGSVYRI